MSTNSTTPGASNTDIPDGIGTIPELTTVINDRLRNLALQIQGAVGGGSSLKGTGASSATMAQLTAGPNAKAPVIPTPETAAEYNTPDNWLVNPSFEDGLKGWNYAASAAVATPSSEECSPS